MSYTTKNEQLRGKAIELIDDYVDAEQTWRDYINREDYIHWSEEGQHEAWLGKYELENELVELVMEGLRSREKANEANEDKNSGDSGVDNDENGN